MTGMLASVASIEEAEIVLDQKVDIIDLKNPRLGALGALDLKVISSIVQFINNRIPTSATIGDIKPNDANLSMRIISTASSGVNYVKVGLFDVNAPDYFINIINECSKKDIKIIVVLFAENITNFDSLEPLMKSNIKGIMLDTKNKAHKNLCSIMKYERLEKFIKLAKSYNLITGLAGSLKSEDIDRLIPLKPDYLGFRGALCSKKNRTESIEGIAVRKIKDIISQRDAISYESILNKEVMINGTMA